MVVDSFFVVFYYFVERGASLKKVLHVAEGPTALRGVRTTLLVDRLGDG